MGTAIGAGLGLLLGAGLGYERQQKRQQFVQEEREAKLMTDIFAKHPEFIKTAEGQKAFKRIYGPNGLAMAQQAQQAGEAAKAQAAQQGLIPPDMAPGVQMIAGAGQPSVGSTATSAGAPPAAATPGASPTGPTTSTAPKSYKVPQTPQEMQEWLDHYRIAVAHGIVDQLPETTQKLIQDQAKRFEDVVGAQQKEAAKYTPEMAKTRGAYEAKIIEAKAPAEIGLATAKERALAPIRISTAAAESGARARAELAPDIINAKVAEETRKTTARALANAYVSNLPEVKGAKVAQVRETTRARLEEVGKTKMAEPISFDIHNSYFDSKLNPLPPDMTKADAMKKGVVIIPKKDVQTVQSIREVNESLNKATALVPKILVSEGPGVYTHRAKLAMQGAMGNPDVQEYNAIAVTHIIPFIRSMTNRLNQREIDLAMQAIPNTGDSVESAQRKIKTLKDFVRLSLNTLASGVDMEEVLGHNAMKAEAATMGGDADVGEAVDKALGAP